MKSSLCLNSDVGGVQKTGQGFDFSGQGGQDMTFPIQTLTRRAVLAMTLALAAPALTASAAVPAESFISENIQKSLSILNDPAL